MSVLIRNLGFMSVVFLVLVSCHPAQPSVTMPPPQVSVLSVKPQTIPLEQDMAGRLSAFRSSDVRARVEGVMIKRLYLEGSDVKAGQPLFQIDPKPFQVALARARSQLVAAQAAFKNAHDTAERARQLAPQQYISRADLDQALANERTAAASVDQANAAVESAQIDLGYTRVTAPISGRAANQQVTEGALVGAAGSRTLLTTIDQIDPLYLNFSMNAAQWTALRASQTEDTVARAGDDHGGIAVVMDDGKTYPHPGQLDFSSATVEPATGAVTLRAIVPNPDHQLLPGAFVHFRALFGERKNVVLLPSSAVLWATNSAYVYCVSPNETVERCQIQTQTQYNNQWVVTNGLKSGDRVIVDGVQKVHDGITVKSNPWQPPASHSTASPGPLANAAQIDE